MLKLLHFAQDEGLQGLWQAWPRPSPEACLTLVVYGLFQAALQRIVPGKRFEGPVTPKGNTPVYKVLSHCTSFLQHALTHHTVFAAAGTLWVLVPFVLLYPLSSPCKLIPTLCCTAGKWCAVLLHHNGCFCWCLGVRYRQIRFVCYQTVPSPLFECCAHAMHNCCEHGR